MMNFHLGNVAPNWIKMMVENTKGKVILFMNEREKEFCPEGIKAYYFPTELYEQQKEKYISEDEFAFEVSINGNADIEEFYVKKLDRKSVV